ncbi:hypothetical protein UCRPA7_391 [Phaeoacremonium minimum UCRPA7]|uniref:Uncharacterized protein n=1 Tax=Phaeoacremonium minimum (strain UCR-PA7) TaxID=1286976 RepID=R8BXN3_PHAM7|nr:hypothetical protein UCRPA7_391 [Phaeoacremonium minimum UCRPA7]EOO04113.1 hypothetical protein UCRPA7_391 [Phaeoacremonium minimum UCRPA7]
MGSSLSTMNPLCEACLEARLTASETWETSRRRPDCFEQTCLVHICGLVREEQAYSLVPMRPQVSAERRMEEGRYFPEDDLQHNDSAQGAQDLTDKPWLWPVAEVLFDADDYLEAEPASPQDERDEDGPLENEEQVVMDPYIDEIASHADHDESPSSDLPLLDIDYLGYQEIEPMSMGPAPDGEEAAATSRRFINAQDSSVI